MKKKTKLLILSVIASLAFSSALASCGKKGGNDDGSSSLTPPASSSEDVSSEDVSSEDVSSEDVSSEDNSSEEPNEVVVTINGDVSVVEFETITLDGVVTGSDDDLTITWTSSDDTIATVDEDGVVTAHKAGTVTITASVEGASATHVLEVTATAIQHEIEFDIPEVRIYEGEFEMVEASVTYDGETLDNDEYGLEYNWEKIDGEDGVVDVETDGATATFTAVAAGTVTYKVSTTARGYNVEKTITVTVMENEYSCSIVNEKISVADGGYKTTLTLEADAELAIGDVKGVLNGEPQDDVLAVEWTTDSDVISVDDGTITAIGAGEGVITGTTTYGGESLTITLTVTVVKNQVTLTDSMTIETAATKSMTLPAAITSTVLKVSIGNNVIFDGVNGKGTFNGTEVEFDQAGMPSKAADLGEGKTMTVETDKAVYSIPVDVYTMVINNAEELDQWQAVAAENAVKAGLCIEKQKGFVFSGYFVLGEDIEYNKLWTPYMCTPGGNGSAYYNCCYQWNSSTNSSDIRADLLDEEGNLIEGAIVEDWGAGEKAGFRGVFDGKGHSIQGLETKGQYSGFIVTMGIDGVVKDVAFTDLKLGSQTGLIERGGKGGLVENVYVEINSIESGTGNTGYATKLISMHGVTALSNIVVNVTDCDFTGIEYAFLLNSAYNVSSNIYVIDRNNLQETKQSFDEDKGATAFLHFNTTSDKGGKFATVEDLLADETHGAIVSAMGGYWKVEDGKLYFGNEQIVTAPERVVIETEYKTNIDKKVVLENEDFTVGSSWTVSVNGDAGEPVTVNEAGKLELEIDPATISGYKAVVVLSSEEKVLSYPNVTAVTYIKDAAGLKAIGMGENNKTATESLKGYYVLANDITFTHAEDYSDVIAAGYHKAGYNTANSKYTHEYSFQGVFDGNGYTIDNMRVSDGGIFGYMDGATVKNLKLTNVHILDNVSKDISYREGGYVSILAHMAPRSTFENIEISVASSPSAFSWKRDGLFVCSSSDGGATYRNITVDASGLKLKTLLGTNHKDSNVYENVVIKAVGYVAIGYTADSYVSGAQNTAALMTELPSGVTFVKVLDPKTKVVFNDGTDLPVYNGDVTELGFAEGTNVVVAEITDLSSSSVKVTTYEDFDYVDVQFLPSKANTICVWDGVKGNYFIYAAGDILAWDNANERKIQVLDAEGNVMSSWEANKVYTLRIYLKDVNGANEVANLKISMTGTSAEDPATIYFGNAVHGNDVKADDAE